jgi:hypothetical protein
MSVKGASNKSLPLDVPFLAVDMNCLNRVKEDLIATITEESQARR